MITQDELRTMLQLLMLELMEELPASDLAILARSVRQSMIEKLKPDEELDKPMVEYAKALVHEIMFGNGMYPEMKRSEEG